MRPIAFHPPPLAPHPCSGTCTGTTFDSVLWLGYGCGTDATAYQCQGGNDDTTGCGSGSQSQVTLTATQRWVYVVVEGYYGSTSGW